MNPASTLHQIVKRSRTTILRKGGMHAPKGFFHDCFRYILLELDESAFLRHWVRLRINLVQGIEFHPLNADDLNEYLKQCDESLKTYLNLDVFDDLEEKNKIMGGEENLPHTILQQNSF